MPIQSHTCFWIYKRDGRLKEGDELLWINGHSLTGLTQQQAVDLLRASRRLIQLVISTEVGMIDNYWPGDVGIQNVALLVKNGTC